MRQLIVAGIPHERGDLDEISVVSHVLLRTVVDDQHARQVVAATFELPLRGLAPDRRIANINALIVSTAAACVRNAPPTVSG